MLIVEGECESIEFKRQSSDYADKLRDSGNDVQLYFLTGKKHFSVVQDLYQSDSELCNNIERFIKLNDSSTVGT